MVDIHFATTVIRRGRKKKVEETEQNVMAAIKSTEARAAIRNQY